MWKQVGQVGVDSGRVMVVDPCYGNDAQIALGDGCEDIEQINFGSSVVGPLALSVVSGDGDGLYPVFVDREKNGRIKRLLVDFTVQIHAP